MPMVFLGLGTNIDRERSLRAGLEAIRSLDPEAIVSTVYECEAVGFAGPPFYNCVVQLNTELSLADLVAELKTIEDSNGRRRTATPEGAKGLDIDVLTYGDWVGCFDSVELPRPDIIRYAHVLLPLSEIAPDACLPGGRVSYQVMWNNYDKSGLILTKVAFSL